MDIYYRLADTSQSFEEGRELFRQYLQSLQLDISFQNVEKELANIHVQYNAPEGALWLAYHGDMAIACVGVRLWQEDIAELKRMYVQDAYRKQGVGKGLMERAIETATQLGYKKIRLDTLSHMQAAISLYESYGFYEIDAYRFNPFEGALYMEKIL